MGLIALIFSVVVDAIWPLRGRPQDRLLDANSPDAALDAALDDDAADPLAEPPYDPLADPLTDPLTPARPAPAPVIAPAHPLQRYALRLIDWVAGEPPSAAGGAAVRPVSLPGWLVVVGLPVVLVAVLQELLGAIGAFLVFVLHVAVLYLTVGLGAFHRQFSELQLLIGAGEQESAQVVLAHWIGSGAPPARARALQPPLARTAAAHSLLACYRDVFAPLFWYAVLPGAIGPVLYLFARFAACHSAPFARTAYYWLDWIPLRLAALGFALVGQFEDTVYCLRAVSPLKPAPEAGADPYLHQRLLLLPVAGGAMGLRLADEAVDAELSLRVPDLDLPGVEPDASSMRPLAGLLVRSGVVWTGIYLLAKLLD
jgi:adenosylcobinamide-phosphate synthase